MMRALLLSAVVSIPAVAAEPVWPQFRGPGGAGVAINEKPPTQIGPDKNVAWKVAVPPGMSSPVIAGDKLFLTAFEKGKLLTIAYKVADGSELWRKEAEAKKIEAFHKTESSPAASTPATDGERLVVYFGSCGLICYDLDGNEQWKYELPVAETNNDFGTGSSPILADGKVILQRDQAKDSRLICVQLKDGSRVWEVKRENAKTSWGSACVWDKHVVVAGTAKLQAFDLQTGAEKWSVSGTPAGPCTTPVIADGRLVFAGWAPGDDFKMPSFEQILKMGGDDAKGYLTKEGSEKTPIKGFFESNDQNKDGKITKEEWDALLAFMKLGKPVALAVKPGGSGDITKSHVEWTFTKGLPQVPTQLVYQGHVYMVNTQGMLTALDLKTGKPVYEEERVGLGSAYASPVAANGHIYLCGMDKSVVVVKAGESPDKVSAAKLDDRISATPAIAGNAIYIRTGSSLYAFKSK
ncbi:MAG: PQQ-binding-like beta-propeller repeat protein [Gemmataceae bacterium]